MKPHQQILQESALSNAYQSLKHCLDDFHTIPREYADKTSLAAGRIRYTKNIRKIIKIKAVIAELAVRPPQLPDECSPIFGFILDRLLTSQFAWVSVHATAVAKGDRMVRKEGYYIFTDSSIPLTIHIPRAHLGSLHGMEDMGVKFPQEEFKHLFNSEDIHQLMTVFRETLFIRCRAEESQREALEEKARRASAAARAINMYKEVGVM